MAFLWTFNSVSSAGRSTGGTACAGAAAVIFSCFSAAYHHSDGSHYRTRYQNQKYHWSKIHFFSSSCLHFCFIAPRSNSRLFSSCCPHQMSIPGMCRIQRSTLLTDTPLTSSCQRSKCLQHTARLSRIEESLPVQPICLQVLFLSMWLPQHMAYTAGRKPKVLLPQPESAKMWSRCHPSELLKLLQHSLLP